MRENSLLPSPVNNQYVSEPAFEEEEQEDIIKVRMVPLEANFDEKDPEAVETIRFTTPEEKDFPPKRATNEVQEIKRLDLLSEEEIIAEANARINKVQ